MAPNMGDGSERGRGGERERKEPATEAGTEQRGIVAEYSGRAAEKEVAVVAVVVVTREAHLTPQTRGTDTGTHSNAGTASVYKRASVMSMETQACPRMDESWTQFLA